MIIIIGNNLSGAFFFYQDRFPICFLPTFVTFWAVQHLQPLQKAAACTVVALVGSRLPVFWRRADAEQRSHAPTRAAAAIRMGVTLKIAAEEPLPTVTSTPLPTFGAINGKPLIILRIFSWIFGLEQVIDSITLRHYLDPSCRRYIFEKWAKRCGANVSFGSPTACAPAGKERRQSCQNIQDSPAARARFRAKSLFKKILLKTFLNCRKAVKDILAAFCTKALDLLVQIVWEQV